MSVQKSIMQVGILKAIVPHNRLFTAKQTQEAWENYSKWQEVWFLRHFTAYCTFNPYKYKHSHLIAHFQMILIKGFCFIEAINIFVTNFIYFYEAPSSNWMESNLSYWHLIVCLKNSFCSPLPIESSNIDSKIHWKEVHD